MRATIRWTPRYVVLAVLAAAFLVPFYVLLRDAGMTQPQIIAPHWQWLPPTPVFGDNLSATWNDPVAHIGLGLMNSAIVAGCTLVGSLAVTSLAGYGLARIDHPWSRWVLMVTVLALLIPGAATFLPLFVMVANLGWVNSYQGLIVPGLFSAFNVLLFRQAFLEFPRELEEAGRLDGLGQLGIFWHLVLPNSRPIFVSLGTLTFLFSWNGFLWPLVIGQDASRWTIQVVLSNFLTSQLINLPELFTAAALGILPVLVVFAFLQRYIVEGYKRSGMTG
jgi:multiple sugar transport system permease protein